MMGRRLVSLLALLLTLGLPLALVAQDTNRAALVIMLQEGETITRCVEFSEPQISGFDLLIRSDLALETDVTGMGASVCQIEDTGCPAGDCFCRCQGDSCQYWSYWHLVDGQWQYSQAGAAAYQVAPGAVEGWTWGVGTPNEAIEPPLVSFDEVCAAEGDTTTADITSSAVAPSATQTGASEAAAVADLAAPGTAGEVSEGAAPTADDTTGVGSWLVYTVFALIVAGLGLLWMAVRRGKGSE